MPVFARLRAPVFINECSCRIVKAHVPAFHLRDKVTYDSYYTEHLKYVLDMWKDTLLMNSTKMSYYAISKTFLSIKHKCDLLCNLTKEYGA